jgi:prepilin-type N-terminal cleavage/methylation domain-containing protein
MRRDGFTLIEIMVVVGILSIVAMLTIPTFHSAGDEKKVAGAAQEIADALCYARSEAMKIGREYRVELVTAAEQVEVFDHQADTVVYHPTSKQLYRLTFGSEGIFAGVDLESVNGGTGNFPLVFTADGRTSTDYVIALAYAGYEVKVFVNALTGRVTTGP